MSFTWGELTRIERMIQNNYRQQTNVSDVVRAGMPALETILQSPFLNWAAPFFTRFGLNIAPSGSLSLIRTGIQQVMDSTENAAAVVTPLGGCTNCLIFAQSLRALIENALKGDVTALQNAKTLVAQHKNAENRIVVKTEDANVETAEGILVGTKQQWKEAVAAIDAALAEITKGYEAQTRVAKAELDTLQKDLTELLARIREVIEPQVSQSTPRKSIKQSMQNYWSTITLRLMSRLYLFYLSRVSEMVRANNEHMNFFEYIFSIGYMDESTDRQLTRVLSAFNERVTAMGMGRLEQEQIQAYPGDLTVLVYMDAYRKIFLSESFLSRIYRVDPNRIFDALFHEFVHINTHKPIKYITDQGIITKQIAHVLAEALSIYGQREFARTQGWEAHVTSEGSYPTYNKVSEALEKNLGDIRGSSEARKILFHAINGDVESLLVTLGSGNLQEGIREFVEIIRFIDLEEVERSKIISQVITIVGNDGTDTPRRFESEMPSLLKLIVVGDSLKIRTVRFLNAILPVNTGWAKPIRTIIGRFFPSFLTPPPPPIQEETGRFPPKSENDTLRVKQREAIETTILQSFLSFIGKPNDIILAQQLHTMLSTNPEVLSEFTDYFYDDLHQKSLTPLTLEMFPESERLKVTPEWLASVNASGNAPQQVWSSVAWPLLAKLGKRLPKCTTLKIYLEQIMYFLMKRRRNYWVTIF